MLNARIPKFCRVFYACIGINLDINKAGSIYMSSGYYELQIPRHLIDCFKSCFFFRYWKTVCTHYSDVVMSAMTSQITSPTIVYSTVHLGADQRKYQSSASLVFVRGIHRWPVNSPPKWPVTRKMFPFDDVIMSCSQVTPWTGTLMGPKPLTMAVPSQQLTKTMMTGRTGTVLK